jgi:hypothetical protein
MALPPLLSIPVHLWEDRGYNYGQRHEAKSKKKNEAKKTRYTIK